MERPPFSEQLPGAEAHAPELQGRLRRAFDARGEAYRPRTHHLRADGSPRFTNRLILETSPYLLQHAHNPVNWYPWGDEAFAHARADAKPVLLSVGYSTCHWCHVMERESFEDEEIAAYLNEHYVAIKVDREERPDVDAIYMTAVQQLTGSGGWPMTVWLTPEREPFYGGTYFPPRTGGAGGRPGFLDLLLQLRAAYDRDPGAVGRQAAQVTARIREVTAQALSKQVPPATTLHAAFRRYAATFDEQHGGFGRAPKFPTPAGPRFLLRYHRRTGNPRALAMVTHTLERMAAGGIYDHIGGGFHRYATDRAWRVPHFEKMLYDNAQLAVLYLEAHQVTGREDFAGVARDVLDYVAREMTAPAGGFYSATDADSEGEEGRFFLWTAEEIAAQLPPAGTAAVIAHYGVTDPGWFEGRNILYVARPRAAVTADLGTDPARLDAVLAEARRTLRAARATREAPLTDTKILTSWNGLMISAFARGGAVLGEPAYLDHARRAATFVLDEMRIGKRLARSDGGGTPRQPGFLDDYAFLAAGLLDLFEATFELRWLTEAIRLHETLAASFWDASGKGFFMTPADHETMLVREKPDYDGVRPSGNAMAAENLLRLAEFTGEERYRERADETLRALAAGLRRSPTGGSRLLAALEFRLDRPREIVVVHPRDTPPTDLLRVVRRTFVPNRMLTVTAEGAQQAEQQAVIPLVAEKRALREQPTAYVCERGVCQLPTADPAVLAKQLAVVHPLAD